MAINETLKFSWGHIIAFVALIIISYVSFMGITYLTDGDFQTAILGFIIIDILLMFFFLTPQLLKATERKFHRRIWIERVVLFLSPIAFVILMIPYAHFWTVFKNRGDIESTFNESINSTKGMFDSYEAYANNRIVEYDKLLVKSKVKEVQRKNKVEALRLQLVDENYNNLKQSAIEWIDGASDATVWNVFMIGNILEIENALNAWNADLNEFSSKLMVDELDTVKAFTSSDSSVLVAKENLNSLGSIYTEKESPSIIAISSGFVLLLFLLFPYVIQGRHTKSTYRILGTETKKIAKNKVMQDEDEYGSFTLD